MPNPRPHDPCKEGANVGSLRDTVIQTARDLWASGVVETAAALAFYALLSFFPMLIAGIIVASYVADPDWLSKQAIDLLGIYLPAGEHDIEKIVESAIDARSRVGILSLGIFLVTGRRILGALVRALNGVSDVSERNDELKRRIAVELALAGGLVMLGILAISSGSLVRFAWDVARVLPGADGPFFRIAQEIVQALLLMVVFTLVYAYVPTGDRRWRAVLSGAGVATLLLLAALGVFSFLIGSIWPNLVLLYGPLAPAALLLSWAWYVALITLAGGGFASHVKVMMLERGTSHQASERHLQR